MPDPSSRRTAKARTEQRSYINHQPGEAVQEMAADLGNGVVGEATRRIAGTTGKELINSVLLSVNKPSAH
jgi:hypothetical protein